MYKRINWKDQAVEYPYRKKLTDRGDGTTDVTSVPGEILVQGTALNAANLNAMDDGIDDASVAEQIIMSYLLNRHRGYDVRLAGHDAEFTPEVGTVTLTNTGKYPFNTSGSTISLATVRKTMNYNLDYEIQSVSGGEVVGVSVYDKQLNGLKLKFEGSATSVVVKYKITGGMTV